MEIDPAKYETLIPKAPIHSVKDLNPQLKLFDDGRIQCWYAPLGKVHRDAKIAVFGLTPGWQQMKVAYDIACRGKQGEDKKESMSRIAFHGSMRTNLVSMLDELGVHRKFSVDTSADLFTGPFMTCSSVLKYPVFLRGRNYSGHSPDPLKHPFLTEMLQTVLRLELERLSNCLVLPLGKVAEACLKHVVETFGVSDDLRLLQGFPHPSGAHAGRLKQFAANKDMLQEQVRSWHP